jgi:hypothetical protein
VRGEAILVGSATRRAAAIVCVILALVVAGCRRSQPAEPAATPASNVSSTPDLPARAVPARDLSADEAKGGHTLSRHVGRTDDELIARLGREPGITSASTYTDRETAERVVGAALDSAGRTFDAWRERRGRRPNFVLHYSGSEVIGRAVSRQRHQSTPCRDALVILRWDDLRREYYVLTSYPEARR